MFGYVALGLPYMYRSVDAGAARDRRAHADARPRESQGAGIADDPVPRHPAQHPLRRSCRGAFLTFAIVIGEFTFASLLDRPAFGPYLQLVGASRAYEPAALAVMAFAMTWALHGPHPASSAAARRSNAASAEDRTMAFLTLTGVQKASAPNRGRQEFRSRRRARRIRHLPRPERLRQDDDAAHDRRLRAADARARSASTAAT